MATAAIHTPAVCEAREGRANHRPEGIHSPDGEWDVNEATCRDCGKGIVSYWRNDEDGPYGWSRWTLRATPVVAPVAKFDAILDLEQAARLSKASQTFAPVGLPDHLANGRVDAAQSAQERLYAAIDALTPEEAVAFGRYRAAQTRG